MLTFCILNLILSYTSATFNYKDFISLIPPTNYNLANAAKTDIIFHLYNSSHTLQTIHLDGNVSQIDFNRSLPIKLIVHGYSTSPKLSPWMINLKDEYFLKQNLNVIHVDWSVPANLLYFISAANVKPVGEYMADFLIATEIPPQNIHLIGHSLGSHLSGFVGKFYQNKTGKKIGRITALDPAGPAFEKLKPDLRLSRGDAEFVDVIHTDIGHYGFSYPLGDVDFYPNGGKKQIACVKDQDDSCDHAKSTHYFVESVNKKKWIAKKSQYDNFNITYPGEVVFGDGVPPSTRGVYYLFINNSTPYPYLRSNRRIM